MRLAIIVAAALSAMGCSLIDGLSGSSDDDGGVGIDAGVFDAAPSGDACTDRMCFDDPLIVDLPGPAETMGLYFQTFSDIDIGVSTDAQLLLYSHADGADWMQSISHTRSGIIGATYGDFDGDFFVDIAVLLNTDDIAVFYGGTSQPFIFTADGLNLGANFIASGYMSIDPDTRDTLFVATTGTPPQILAFRDIGLVNDPQWRDLGVQVIETEARGLIIRDVTGDGLDDIIHIHSGANDITTFEGQISAMNVFSTVHTIRDIAPAGRNVRAVTTGFLSSGVADLIIGISAPAETNYEMLRVVDIDGNVTGIPYIFNGEVGFDLIGLEQANFDGDGFADIAILDRNGNETDRSDLLLLFGSDAGWGTETYVSAGGSVQSMLSFDFNGDDLNDFAANADTASELRIILSRDP